MTSATEQFLPAHAVTARRAGLDGSWFAAVLVYLLLMVPEGSVVSFLPMNLQPVLVFALGLGLLWFGCHLVSTIGMAKGRASVRTALFLYLSCQLVTFGIATRRYLLPDEAKAADSSMVKIFAIIGAAVFICDAVRGWPQINRVAKAVAIAVTLSSIVGLVQFLTGFDPVTAISLPGLRPLGHFDTIQLRDGLRRPAATADHPIEFGMFCAMAVPISLQFALSARARGRRAHWWWAAVAIDLAGGLVSVSRTAILCLAVAGLVIVIFAPGWQKITIPVVGLAFLGIVGAAVPHLLGTFYNLVFNASDDPSVTGRTQDYPVAWDQVAVFPWFGRGYGTYFPTRYQLLDNQYLLSLIENGWVGTAAFVLVMLASVLAALRARALLHDAHQRGMAAALIAAVMVAAVGAGTFDMLTYVLVNGLLFVVVGLCCALLRTARADAGTRAGLTPRDARFEER